MTSRPSWYLRCVGVLSLATCFFFHFCNSFRLQSPLGLRRPRRLGFSSSSPSFCSSLRPSSAQSLAFSEQRRRTSVLGAGGETAESLSGTETEKEIGNDVGVPPKADANPDLAEGEEDFLNSSWGGEEDGNEEDEYELEEDEFEEEEEENFGPIHGADLEGLEEMIGAMEEELKDSKEGEGETQADDKDPDDDEVTAEEQEEFERKLREIDERVFGGPFEDMIEDDEVDEAEEPSFEDENDEEENPDEIDSQTESLEDDSDECDAESLEGSAEEEELEEDELEGDEEDLGPWAEDEEGEEEGGFGLNDDELEEMFAELEKEIEETRVQALDSKNDLLKAKQKKSEEDSSRTGQNSVAENASAEISDKADQVAETADKASEESAEPSADILAEAEKVPGLYNEDGEMVPIEELDTAKLMAQIRQSTKEITAMEKQLMKMVAMNDDNFGEVNTRDREDRRQELRDQRNLMRAQGGTGHLFDFEPGRRFNPQREEEEIDALLNAEEGDDFSEEEFDEEEFDELLEKMKDLGGEDQGEEFEKFLKDVQERKGVEKGVTGEMGGDAKTKTLHFKTDDREKEENLTGGSDLERSEEDSQEGEGEGESKDYGDLFGGDDDEFDEEDDTSGDRLAVNSEAEDEEDEDIYDDDDMEGLDGDDGVDDFDMDGEEEEMGFGAERRLGKDDDEIVLRDENEFRGELELEEEMSDDDEDASFMKLTDSKRVVRQAREMEKERAIIEEERAREEMEQAKAQYEAEKAGHYVDLEDDDQFSRAVKAIQKQKENAPEEKSEIEYEIVAKEDEKNIKMNPGDIRAKLNVNVNVAKGVKDFAGLFDGFFLDQFGVIHDGTQVVEGAVQVVKNLVNRKKPVVILSNSSRRIEFSRKRLEEMGFPLNDPHLQVVTSGELVWLGLKSMAEGEKECHLPPEFRDIKGKRVAMIGSGDDDVEYVTSAGLTITSVDKADFVLARGMKNLRESDKPEKRVDLHLTPRGGRPFDQWLDIQDDALVDFIDKALARNIPMVVANPDFERPDGTDAVMPGVIAHVFTQRGGDVRPIGKPFPLIFKEGEELLMAMLAKIEQHRMNEERRRKAKDPLGLKEKKLTPEEMRRRSDDTLRFAMIGDSLPHDVIGAYQSSMDSVFVASGVHANELGVPQYGDAIPSTKRLEEFFDNNGLSKAKPAFVLPKFQW